jgi:hypothetical protein
MIRHVRRARITLEPLGQQIGPALIRVRCRPESIGDRIAERHNRARRRRPADFNGAQEVKGLCRRHSGEIGRSGEVARARDIVRLQPDVVVSCRSDVARQVDTYSQVAERGHRQRDRIADHERAGGNRNRGRTVKSYYPIRSVDNRCATGAQRDVGCADDDVAGAEDIRQAQAGLVTADARVDDLP